MIATTKLFGPINDKLIAVAAVVLSIGVFQPVYSATILTDLQQGIQSYNSKKFSDAVAHLQLHLGTRPNDAVARYYLANCLKNLGYDEPSLAEYERALSCSTSPQLTGYCRQAIEIANASKRLRAGLASQPVVIEPESAPIETASFVGMPRMMPREARGGLQDLVLAKALDRMKQQSNDQLEIFAKNGSAETQAIMEHLAADISRAQRDGDAKIQALSDNAQMTWSYSSKKTLSLQDSRVASIQQDVERRIELLKTAAKGEIEKQQNDNARLGQKFQADVRNLQNQLAESRRIPGSPNLQLIGTDVYTRVYASPSGEPLREPPPPEEM
jgi:hypothetical protein